MVTWWNCAPKNSIYIDKKQYLHLEAALFDRLKPFETTMSRHVQIAAIAAFRSNSGALALACQWVHSSATVFTLCRHLPP
jgi:hypothetical protein